MIIPFPSAQKKMEKRALKAKSSITHPIFTLYVFLVIKHNHHIIKKREI